MDGGSLRLLGLIAAHRGAVEYDLRSRFGLGLRDIGERVTLPELARLVDILMADPSSMVAAAIEGWTHPISREAAVLMDLFDLNAAAHSGKKKPAPYPGRPWASKSDVKRERRGNAADRSPAEIRDILNTHGHALPPV